MSQTRSRYYLKSYAANTIACFPEDVTKTGTVTITAGEPIAQCAGTGADFSDIKPGNFLVLATTGNSEAIEITEVDYTSKILKLRFNAANAHAAVPIRIVGIGKLNPQLCYVSVAVKASATSLIVNGNAINPTDLGANKFNWQLDPLNNEPLVVEANAAFAISNTESIH